LPTHNFYGILYLMLVFTDHALKRMNERKVTKSQVTVALKTPDIITDEEDGVKIFRKKLGNKILEVVAEIKKNKFIVITLYWL
jgi:hypothetical protein